MVINVAVVYNMATVDLLKAQPAMSFHPSSHDGSAAADSLAELLAAHGWRVELEPPAGGYPQPDLVAAKGPLRYAVELKSVGEGRPDRVLAFLSQAILQANRQAKSLAMSPLAVVHVGHASPSLFRKVEQFHSDYAPDIAIGLMSDAGGRHFIGLGLDELNVEPPLGPRGENIARPRKASDPFSDLNQWMLKVLLAPELPEDLLHAPRRDCRTVSELAEVAQVSAMSASRFVRVLQEDGFLEHSGRSLRLVRRGELFRRWQSAAMRSTPELRMCYLIPGGAQQLNKAAAKLDGCVGLFAAADALNLGHVSGVPPYLYVRRLAPSSAAGRHGLVPAKPGEQPHLILKQANAPESLFRGAVRVDGALVSDVIQVWLDASAHPSRGMEQADFLRHGVLSGIMGENP